MGAALAIRDDLTPEALRRHARHEPNRRAALRMLAIANALEGRSRAEAARLAGMERQALRDAVVRYNAKGLTGLYDRPKPGRPERLSEAEQAALMVRVFRGPDPDRDGVSAWTRADLCGGLEERFGCHSTLQPVEGAQALALSRQKTVPSTQADRARERFRKMGCACLTGRPRASGRGSRCCSCMRPGRQKGRLCHRWGHGRCRRGAAKGASRYYIFAAVEPSTRRGRRPCLRKRPRDDDLFLPNSSGCQRRPRGLFLDRAAGDRARALAVPANLHSSAAAYSPELNPVERSGALRERFLSCGLGDYRAIVDACCTPEPARADGAPPPLCDHPVQKFFINGGMVPSGLASASDWRAVQRGSAHAARPGHPDAKPCQCPRPRRLATPVLAPRPDGGRPRILLDSGARRRPREAVRGGLCGGSRTLMPPNSTPAVPRPCATTGETITCGSAVRPHAYSAQGRHMRPSRHLEYTRHRTGIPSLIAAFPLSSQLTLLRRSRRFLYAL